MSNNISVNVNLDIEKVCNCTDSGVIKLFREDVEEIVEGAQQTYIGTGYAVGEDKEIKAARIAIENPFMLLPINGALKVLITFTVPLDIEVDDINIASDIIVKAAHPDAKVLFGLYFNEKMEDEIRVDIIATK